MPQVMPFYKRADKTPTAFAFVDETDADVSTSYESNAIVVAGIDAPAQMTITGGQYQVGGGAWASTPRTVRVGNSIKVRATSSVAFETAVNVVLTIGGVSDTFTITTAAEGGVPEWVPEGDTGFLQFLDEHYFADGEEQSIGDILGANIQDGRDFDPVSITASGMELYDDNSNRPTILGALRDEMPPGNFSMRITWDARDSREDDTPFGLLAPNKHYLLSFWENVLEGEEVVDELGFELHYDIRFDDGTVRFTFLDYYGASTQVPINFSYEGRNRAAISFASASSVKFSANGSDAESDSSSTDPATSYSALYLGCYRNASSFTLRGNIISVDIQPGGMSDAALKAWSTPEAGAPTDIAVAGDMEYDTSAPEGTIIGTLSHTGSDPVTFYNASNPNFGANFTIDGTNIRLGADASSVGDETLLCVVLAKNADGWGFCKSFEFTVIP